MGTETTSIHRVAGTAFVAMFLLIALHFAQALVPEPGDEAVWLATSGQSSRNGEE